MTPILQIDDLTVSYRQGNDWLDAVRDVSLRIEAGETVGLVGESGSGKSTLALAVLRALPENGVVRQGSMRLAGRGLLGLTPAEMQQVWREQIKLVPQNPLVSLNPAMRIGQQLAEALPSSPPARGQRNYADRAVLDALAAVQIADPPAVARSYPHQLSGGMQQRVMIAMALLGEPLLLVLDEPTTNLDVTTEAVILDLVRDLIRQRGTSVLYVSHNLGVLAGICDRVAVLYAGELVEDARVAQLYRRPLHPYTLGLLDSVPRLGLNRRQAALLPIPGSVPRLDERPAGCVFAPRCPVAVALCQQRPQPSPAQPDHLVRCHRWAEIQSGALKVTLVLAVVDDVQAASDADANGETVLTVRELTKRFDQSRSLADLLAGRPARAVRAVDGVNVQIGRGRTLGLVGESGSGKTTLARCVVGLTERSGGDVTLLDLPLAPALNQRNPATLRRLQMVFQNPDEALNPYRTVGQTLTRTLSRLAGLPKAEAQQRAGELLALVKLDLSYLERLPGQLSGGEKQRVSIARAFASQPDLLLFDESVSALDVSVQAAILNLLSELQEERQTAYLFISHDLAVVSYLADDVAVMYLGQVVEVGPTEHIFQPPHHPYTAALLSAIPVLDPADQRQRIHLQGDIPSAAAMPSGCRFHTRCPRFLGDLCVQQEPSWQDGGDGHWIRCHITVDELARGAGSG
ncbi:MAG TPA: ABC transporter ATP-binding protein [Anaerolineae bacterium]|nr:ABC transporter ATP-binding protein [Anaerolineae bacterium]